MAVATAEVRPARREIELPNSPRAWLPVQLDRAPKPQPLAPEVLLLSEQANAVAVPHAVQNVREPDEGATADPNALVFEDEIILRPRDRQPYDSVPLHLLRSYRDTLLDDPLSFLLHLLSSTLRIRVYSYTTRIF